jgi:hypothetical protein
LSTWGEVENLNAVDVLTEAKNQLDQHKGIRVADIGTQFLSDTFERLAACPESDVFKNKWLILADGGLSSAEIWSGPMMFALSRLIDGGTPVEIINEIKKQIEENSAELIEVTEISGITTNEIVQIDDNTWVYPNKALPDDPSVATIFRRRAGRMGFVDVNTAALVVKFKATPMLVDQADNAFAERLSQQNQKLSVSRSTYRSMVRRALILATDGPVELNYSYIGAERSIFTGIGIRGRLHSYEPMINAPLDAEQTVDFLQALKRFPGVRGLEVAIDRIGSSRLPHDQEDIAIDLGIALEALLMHGEQESNNEIGYKLGLRAGWLIGTTVAERIETKKRVGDLYSARSKGAHGAAVSAKFDAKDARDLVLSLVRAILNRGTFPNWAELTFGA